MEENINALVFKAEALYVDGRYGESAEMYLKLEKYPQYRAWCRFMLANISSIMGDPETAYNLYYSAFNEDNAIFRNFSVINHPNHNYIFPGKMPEKEYKNCPLCGKAGRPHWCYPLVEWSNALPVEFNPVRMWLMCDDCKHMFASSFPENWGSDDRQWRSPTTVEELFPYYSKILDVLEVFSTPPKGSGRRWLLEAGLGGCEFILTASKRGYKVLGIDIVKGIVDHARKLGLNAEVSDFYKKETDKKWNVLIMGDVLEHVPDPVAWIEKCSELMDDEGVLWISTPDFESDFAVKTGHSDPMRREVTHLNYFSKDSLYMLLRRFGLEPVADKASGHYGGSIEVIVVKAERVAEEPT
jgi:SAM-dependent methyltransferase